MTQQTERDALRKLAEAATPGPWAFGTFHRLLVVQADKHGYADKHSAIADIGAGSIPWDETAESMQEYNDAEYIAAANPAAVITLLDQLQSQAERIKELEEEIGGWREDQKENIGVAFALQREVNKITSERDELREKYTDTYWALDDAARENTSLRAQLAEIEKTEPVAYMVQFSPGSRWIELTKEEFDSDLDGHIVYKKQAFFTHPMPAQRLTELKLLMLTTAYEQGVGKGIQRRDCNPYAADTDEHAAWKLGYEEGLDKPMPAKDAETGMINLPEPVGYIRSDQLRKVQDGWAYLCDVGPAPRIDKLPLYTEAQLKQAVRDALDTQGVTELVEALEMIVSTHQGHCEHHVGVSKHSYNLADIAEEALSKYKGAK